MQKVLILTVLATLPVVAACGGAAKAEEKPGSRATVAVEGTTYAVSDVKFAYHPGEDGYFRIEGDDARHVHEDCVPGVSSGLALYGNLPSGVNSPVELSEKEVPFEFSGDGDDRNLCFVGSKGLLGVEKGTVKFGRVFGGAIAFTFSGDFKRFDGEGGESESTVHASGSGTATIR
ncbi:MAG TPA: hypothetical protein VGQ37_23055 [Vicinamibacterales bacterium]|nr:hypothetical protein [Vicinamibacterales bacterium]